MVPTVVRPKNQTVSPYSSNDEVWPRNMKGFKMRLFMALHLKDWKSPECLQRHEETFISPHTCTRRHTCTHSHMHARTHACMHTHTHTHAHTHSHAHTHTHTHTSTHTQLLMVMGWYNEKKKMDQHAVEKRWIWYEEKIWTLLSFHHSQTDGQDILLLW